MANPIEFPVWRTPEGEPVSCVDKIKVLNENLDELAAMAAETVSMPIAVLQGLDKETARVSKFDAPVGKAVTFGTLTILVRACQKTPPEQMPESGAFLQVTETQPGQGEVPVFSGWMFASSPALSALENPVYDLNLLDCKAASTSPPGAADAGSAAGKSAR